MSHAAPKLAPKPSRQRTPPLETGDHLSRPEFERRYAAASGVSRAELIRGIAFVSPPVSYVGHANPHFQIIALLGQYVLATPGVTGADNASVRFDLDNMPQPDVQLLISPGTRGGITIDEDDILSGVPNFILEVAASSASLDLHWKLDLYRSKGVQEYVVWRTFDGEMDYFILRDGQYQQHALQPSGELQSIVLPGLWLDVPAILAGNWVDAVKTLQRGIDSEAHRDFVQRLAGQS